MSARTDLALARPCQAPTDCLAPELAHTEQLAGGNLLHSILAVDR